MTSYHERYLLFKSKRLHFAEPGHYNAADRRKMPDSDFAGPPSESHPQGTFPIRTEQDVEDASRLTGHAKNPAAVRRKIKRIARRKGLPTPESWQ